MAEDNIFNDEEFALKYAEKHQKMANSFGDEYTRKLKARGFGTGKVLDAGCGFGGTLLYLAKNFPDAQFVGIDMSDTLLELGRQTAAVEGLEERVSLESGFNLSAFSSISTARLFFPTCE